MQVKGNKLNNYSYLTKHSKKRDENVKNPRKQTSETSGKNLNQRLQKLILLQQIYAYFSSNSQGQYYGSSGNRANIKQLLVLNKTEMQSAETALGNIGMTD